MSRLAVLIITAALLLTACASGGTANPTAGEASPGPLMTIRLPMGYIPNVQYAPFYVAVDKGYFRQAGIEIEFDYSAETDGIALVGANELQFTIASAEQVLLARAQGLPVVYVLSWWQDFPVGVASFAEADIRRPDDLAGKKIGIPGLYGASYIGLRALLNAGELEEEDVVLDSIGFNQVEALVAGQEDAIVIYVNNEPVQLAERGYPVEVMPVADYVSLASNGLVTNEATMAQDPELIRRMVQAILKGIADTTADPDEAFEISKKYVEGLEGETAAIQRKVLEATLPFWEMPQGQDPGSSRPEAWENMQAVLLDMGLLAELLDLSAAYSNEFVRP